MTAKDFLAANSVLAERARLAIMAILAAADEPVDFSSLLEKLELSKGNLSSHVRKLEEAKLLRVHKEFVDRKPRTTFECTALGRRELRDYLSRLEAMLSAARADSGGQ